MAALSPDEELVLRELAAQADETPARFRRHAAIMLVGAIVVAGLAAVREAWFLVPVCVGFGLLMFWIGRVAARKNGAERSEPVLRALREAPERVIAIVHTKTSDSMQLFVSHWIVVATRDGQLRVKSEDWERVLSVLAGRCPDAKLTGRAV